MRKFKERTNREYTRRQHKNKWDSLKRDYTNWKTLKNNSSGLGIDPNTGTIAASEEWWKLQCEAMPTCVKIRKGPLEYEELLSIMFEGASCTNASAVVPGAKEDMGDEDDHNEEGGGDTPEEVATPTSSKHNQRLKTSKEKRSMHQHSPNGLKLEKSFRDVQFKRLIDSFVEKSQSIKSSSVVSSEQSLMDDPVRKEIALLLDQVIDAGAIEGSDEYFFATQLLIKKQFRDVFVTLKTPEGRLAWLRRTWNEKKKC
ncbi:hypothetical protein GUJ93_ZPchr0003g17731 [Zizania palustris]|uniref:Myb/SANT-like domain-containing protein n=1 Tax=Zizania palustris TaxID=103762 RepID=A0A8J5SIV9_ZIZPA|nr:hypothetical protein GUJ93_ZPchr0003g17731 [Zizania palustris]